jgi:hypothetical protein
MTIRDHDHPGPRPPRSRRSPPPNAPSSAATASEGLVRNGASGRVALEASRGASLAGIALSADGALAAGVVSGRARAWDLVTGRALLR